MKKIILFSMLLCVSACGSYRNQTIILNPIMMPDGGKGYALSCREDANCWELAGSGICPTGYTIIDTHATNGWSFGAGGGVAGGRSKHNSTMIIECK
jgi:hypothetical protein